MVSAREAFRWWLKSAYMAALLSLALTLPLEAQSVHGVLLEQGAGAPIEGAMVHLLDGSGSTILSRFTDKDGRFVLSAPAPGKYMLRADRIGYESSTSAPFALEAGQIFLYRLEIQVKAISLDGIVATATRKRCTVRPGGGDAAVVALVWEEARKALAATAWAQRERVFRYDAWSYTRRLEGPRERVVEEKGRPLTGFSTQPYKSLPAEDLAEHGYVRAIEGGRFYDFFAPNAEVLLSDPFLDHHCLKLVDAKPGMEGLIGLGFEPVAGRNVPEIEGTLWLDRKSAELRRLDYRYAGLDAGVPGEGAGGSVEFAALPTGAWIVKAWSIRTPVMATERVHWSGQTHLRPRVIAMQEEGGEVVRTYTATGQPIEIAVRSTLTGGVVDSTNAGAPLAGARVRLTGTTYTTVTDATGRFRLTGVPAGTYGAEFSHPRLDSLPLAALPPVEVVFEAGQEAQVELTVPPLDRILAAACPAPEADSTRTAVWGIEFGVLVGRLRISSQPGGAMARQAPAHAPEMEPARGRATQGAGAAPARVSLRWVQDGIVLGSAVSGDAAAVSGGAAAVVREPWQAELSVDEEGRFWTCQLPLNTPIRIAATWEDGQTARATVRMRSSLHFLELSPGISAAVQETDAQVERAVVEGVALQVIRTRLVPELGGGTAVVGRLQDQETGEPISGAQVRLDGNETTVTGANGNFRLLGTRPGLHSLRFQHIAYGDHQESVAIDAGTEALVVVSLAPQPISLDPVVVTGRTQLQREARRATTRRDLLVGTELAEAVRRGNTIIDAVRRFPGITVSEGRFGTTEGVANGVCIESIRRIARLVAPSTGAPFCEAIPVIIDGLHVGNSVTILKDLRLEEFESVELVGPVDASIRYGMAAASAGGALLLRTRRGGK